jgi:hypothetical protein
LKAFYESLRTTDLLNVSRRLQSSKTLPSGADQVLFVAGIQADHQSISDEDSRFFDHWIATGGRLIIALRPYENQPADNRAAPRANQEESEQAPSILWQSQLRRWGVRIAPLREIPSSTANSPVFGTIPRWLGRSSFDRLNPEWKVIAFQGNHEVIVERAFDHGGSLVLMADCYPLSNEALAAERNTGFLLWLLDNRPAVLFDETHLGLSEQPGIMTLAQRYGLQGALISIVAVLLLFIWKCQYTLVPRSKLAQEGSTISGSSSELAFLNLLHRAVSRKDLLNVCLTTWLKTARPTSAQLEMLEKFRSDAGPEKTALEGYNQLTTLLKEKL